MYVDTMLIFALCWSEYDGYPLSYYYFAWTVEPELEYCGRVVGNPTTNGGG